MSDGKRDAFLSLTLKRSDSTVYIRLDAETQFAPGPTESVLCSDLPTFRNWWGDEGWFSSQQRRTPLSIYGGTFRLMLG